MTKLPASEAGQRLIDDVLVPLVLGGALVPLPHVTEHEAPEVVQAAMQLFSPAVGTQIDLQRVRTARRLAPVDTVPGIDGNIFGMLLAFSNLLRATDPEVDSLFSSDSSASIHHSALDILRDVRPVSSALDALGRHSVFSRALLVTRLEVKVSWWCGSESFSGREPPRRLLAWQDLRRVHQEREHGLMTNLQLEAPGASEGSRFLAGIQELLHLTPLTDVATILRPRPEFGCYPGLLRLLADPQGRVLAVRAMRQLGASAADAKLRQACHEKRVTPQGAQVIGGVVAELQAWASM